MVKRSDRKEERQKRNKLTAAAPATMFNKKSRSLFVPNQFVPLSGMLCLPLGLSPKCHVRFLQLFGVYGGVIILFFYVFLSKDKTVALGSVGSYSTENLTGSNNRLPRIWSSIQWLKVDGLAS